MPKRIIFVGHCGPDCSYLRTAVRAAAPDALIQLADDMDELSAAIRQGVDLLLVNRVLDYGYPTESGIELMASLHETHPSLKWMLISNYPDSQNEAVKLGALPGFGKRDIGRPLVSTALQDALK